MFHDELMTGWIARGRDQPLSATTVASLQDIGYTVDMSKVDVYAVPSGTAARSLEAAPPGFAWATTCSTSAPSRWTRPRLRFTPPAPAPPGRSPYLFRQRSSGGVTTVVSITMATTAANSPAPSTGAPFTFRCQPDAGKDEAHLAARDHAQAHGQPVDAAGHHRERAGLLAEDGGRR